MNKLSITFTLKELVDFTNQYVAQDPAKAEAVLSFVGDFTGLSVDCITEKTSKKRQETLPR